MAVDEPCVDEFVRVCPWLTRSPCRPSFFPFLLQTLSDQQKKQRYDSGVDLEDDHGHGHGHGGHDMNDIFASFFAQRGGGGGGGGGRGGFGFG